MIRDIKIVPIFRRGGKALCAVPRHVLRGHDGAVDEEDEVEHPVADDGFLVLGDDAREDGPGGGLAGVGLEDGELAFLPVVGDRGVDCFLYVGAWSGDWGLVFAWRVERGREYGLRSKYTHGADS